MADKHQRPWLRRDGTPRSLRRVLQGRQRIPDARAVHAAPLEARNNLRLTRAIGEQSMHEHDVLGLW